MSWRFNVILKKKNPYHRGIYLANVTNDFFFLMLHCIVVSGAVRCGARQYKKKKKKLRDPKQK